MRSKLLVLDKNNKLTFLFLFGELCVSSLIEIQPTLEDEVHNRLYLFKGKQAFLDRGISMTSGENCHTNPQGRYRFKNIA